MSERIDVFLSSTSRDLTLYRDAVTKAILRLGLHPIIMEAFTPTDRNALQLCYDKVQEAEIFVGIYAYRYGYAPDSDITYQTTNGQVIPGDGQTGITHLEYLWAIERNLPILLFVVSDTNVEGQPLQWAVPFIEDEPGKSRLKQFKDMIMSKHVVGFFNSPDHLASQATAGLAEVKSQLLHTQIQPATSGTPSSPPSLLTTTTYTTTMSTTSTMTVMRRRDFFKHVQLPPNYVPRTKLISDLCEALINTTKPDRTSTKNIITLHGMGGIGKSVMARSLCDDPEVKNTFTDGILWTTLGQEPNITAKLQEWIATLGGVISENEPTIDSLKATLAELLEDQAYLLIVDDIWQKKHAEAFRVGGERCRLLITTRDAEIARRLGAEVKSIPTMNSEEAIVLLKDWAGDNLDNSDPNILTQIIEKLGRLPLAIKLAGAELHRKSPEKWLERFNARKLASKRPEDVHDSLELTFGLSLETLQETDRKLYSALAIFKEDEPIREVAIVRLWSALDDLDVDEAEDLLDDLASRALLEVVGEEFPRAAVLHDLLRDFIGEELEDASSAHQALLDNYHDTWQGDSWSTTPDDGYIYEHLVYHLLEAGHLNILQALLLDFKWLQRMLDVTDMISLLDDYELVLSQLANPDITLVKEALQLSSHVLVNNKSQLPSQLVGRLLVHDTVLIQGFLAQARAYTETVWLEPLNLALMQAGGSLYCTLSGHRRALWTVDISRDKSLIASGDEAGIVILWSLKTREAIASFNITNASQPIGEVLFSHDNKYLFIGTRDGTIAKLNIKTQEFEDILVTRDGQTIWAMAITSDSQHLAMAYPRGNLKIWNLTDGTFIPVEGHTNNVWWLYMSRDDRYMVSASVDKTVCVWDVKSGERLAELRGHTKGANSAIFDHTGNYVISASSDSTVRVWDWRNEREVDSWIADDLGIWALAMSDDGQKLLTVSTSRMLKTWSMSKHNAHNMQAIEGHSMAIWDGVMSRDGELGVTASEDTTVRVWKLDKREELATPAKHLMAVRALAISRDGALLLSGASECTVNFWGSDTGDLLNTVEGHIHTIWGVAISPDQRHFLSTSADRTILIRSIESGEILYTLHNPTGALRTALFSPDGHFVVSGSNDRTVKIWDWQNETILRTLRGHTGSIKDIALTDDCRFILSASADGTIRVWQMDTGEFVRTLTIHEGWVRAINIDGNMAVSGGSDGTIALWNIDIGTLETRFEAHENAITDVLLDRSNRRIISASLDGHIKVWDLSSQELQAVFSPDDRIHCLAISPNGQTIFAGGRSGKVYFLKLRG